MLNDSILFSFIVRKAPRSLSRRPWTVICSLRDDEHLKRQGLPEAKRADPDIKKSGEVGRWGGGVSEADKVITAAAF